MSYNDYRAPKYDPNLKRDDIKARILADLKAAVASGELPACKPSVREGRGGYTLSLTVTLRELRMPLVDVDCLAFSVGAEKENPYGRRGSAYTPAAQTALDRAKVIADAYNFDKSEIETDYFHVGYYLHVEVDSKQFEAEKAQLISACSAKRHSIGVELRSRAVVASDAAQERGDKRGEDLALTAKRDAYGCREYLARCIDKLAPALAATATLRKLEAAPEDWDASQGTALQAVMFSAQVKLAPAVVEAAVGSEEASEKRRAAARKAVATRRSNAAKAVAS